MWWSQTQEEALDWWCDHKPQCPLWHHNQFFCFSTSSKEKWRRGRKHFSLPGFNGTFNRQGAVYPVIDGLLWTEEIICVPVCEDECDGQPSVRCYWLWLCGWWRSAVPQRRSATGIPPCGPRPHWRCEPPQTTRSGKKKTPTPVNNIGPVWFSTSVPQTQTSYELKHMLPSCRMEDRMAQMVEIWSACKPIVSKQRIRSWKSCLSCFPFSSQEPP